MVHFVEDVGVDVQRHMDVRMTQPGFEHDCRDASLDSAGRESMAQSMLAAGFDPGSAKDLPELTVHSVTCHRDFHRSWISYIPSRLWMLFSLQTLKTDTPQHPYS